MDIHYLVVTLPPGLRAIFIHSSVRLAQCPWVCGQRCDHRTARHVLYFIVIYNALHTYHIRMQRCNRSVNMTTYPPGHLGDPLVI